MTTAITGIPMGIHMDMAIMTMTITTTTTTITTITIMTIMTMTMTTITIITARRGRGTRRAGCTRLLPPRHRVGSVTTVSRTDEYR